MPAVADLEKVSVRLGDQDNVLTALRDIEPGEYRLEGQAFAVRDAIPTGHKLAIRDITAGEKVLKYNSPIGVATADIRAGTHVHSHNLRSLSARPREEEVSGGH